MQGKMTSFDFVIPPVDPNWYDKKKKEGYQHDVILFYHEKNFRQKAENFWDKDYFLKLHSGDSSLPYYDFMEMVYGDTDELTVITADSSYTTMNRDDLLDYMQNRDDVYVAPCTFINGCYRTDTCMNVHAFVIDIDEVKASVINQILNNGTLGGIIPMPTIITNSGNGLHFYYVLERKVPFFKKQREEIHKIYRKLYSIVKNNIAAKADWHSIIQPFRLPGALTRLGFIATAYQFYEKWAIEDLARAVGFDGIFDAFEWDFSERVIISQKIYKKQLKHRQQLYENGQGQKTAPQKRKLKNKPQKDLKKFYTYSLKRVYEKTEEGNRYRSLVALAMIGHKAKIPKEILQKDFEELVKHFNKIGSIFHQKEIKKALRAYNSKADKTRSEVLEEYFGWEFERWRAKAKANAANPNKPKFNLHEHLEEARAIRDIRQKRQGKKWTDNNGRPKGSHSAKETVWKWRKNNPEGKKMDCHRTTGLSRPTIDKWWNEVDEQSL